MIIAGAIRKGIGDSRYVHATARATVFVKKGELLEKRPKNLLCWTG